MNVFMRAVVHCILFVTFHVRSVLFPGLCVTEGRSQGLFSSWKWVGWARTHPPRTSPRSTSASTRTACRETAACRGVRCASSQGGREARWCSPVVIAVQRLSMAWDFRSAGRMRSSRVAAEAQVRGDGLAASGWRRHDAESTVSSPTLAGAGVLATSARFDAVTPLYETCDRLRKGYSRRSDK